MIGRIWAFLCDEYDALLWRAGRIRRERERSLGDMMIGCQVTEDTCIAHGVFCCPSCFETS